MSAIDRLVESYVRLIKADKIELDKVPQNLIELVKAKLDEN